jgi:hypothetical protein
LLHLQRDLQQNDHPSVLTGSSFRSEAVAPKLIWEQTVYASSAGARRQCLNLNFRYRPKPDMTGSAYSITSSARARINGGIVRPSALVDDEIECGRLLNRKISRLSSLQGAVDIASGAAKDVEDAGAP